MTEPTAYTPDLRDTEKNPYSADEKRVCEYLQKLAPDIGCGNDPIGFLIASHAALRDDKEKITENAIRALGGCGDKKKHDQRMSYDEFVAQGGTACSLCLTQEVADLRQSLEEVKNYYGER